MTPPTALPVPDAGWQAACLDDGRMVRMDADGRLHWPGEVTAALPDLGRAAPPPSERLRAALWALATSGAYVPGGQL